MLLRQQVAAGVEDLINETHSTLLQLTASIHRDTRECLNKASVDQSKKQERGVVVHGVELVEGKQHIVVGKPGIEERVTVGFAPQILLQNLGEEAQNSSDLPRATQSMDENGNRAEAKEVRAATSKFGDNGLFCSSGFHCLSCQKTNLHVLHRVPTMKEVHQRSKATV